MKGQVRPHVLASARHVQLLIKMSVAISMSMNQSSSFELSCSLNVGISCSRVMVIFACIGVCLGSFGWEFGCGGSIIVRCHSHSASCSNSPIFVGLADRFQVGESVPNCWNLSSNAAM